MELESTVLEQAALMATTERHGIVEKALFTGRALVKRAYVDMELLDPTDEEELSQYAAPELRPWARSLLSYLKPKNPRVDTANKVFGSRILAINNLAQDEPDEVLFVVAEPDKS